MGVSGALVSDTSGAVRLETETLPKKEDEMTEMETLPIAEELQPPKKIKKPLDGNIYSTKKTVAQGMMDIALLTANASQLKLLLKYNQDKSAIFFIHIACICVSLALQMFMPHHIKVTITRSPSSIFETRENLNQKMIDFVKYDILCNISSIYYFLAMHSIRIYFGYLYFYEIVVGVMLILNSRYDINRPSHHSRADTMNNLTVVGIFLITVVNVLAASFSDST